jgi:hypothetical protein
MLARTMDVVQMAAYFCLPISSPCQRKTTASAAHAQQSFQGFRDRLAAAEDKRVITSSSPIVDHTSVPETTAVSRAAALRARLKSSKRG